MKFLLFIILSLPGAAFGFSIKNFDSAKLKCDNGNYYEFENGNSISLDGSYGSLNGLIVATDHRANIHLTENGVNVEVLKNNEKILEFEPEVRSSSCFHEICTDTENLRAYSFKFEVNKNETTCYLYLSK